MGPVLPKFLNLRDFEAEERPAHFGTVHAEADVPWTALDRLGLVLARSHGWPRPEPWSFVVEGYHNLSRTVGGTQSLVIGF